MRVSEFGCAGVWGGLTSKVIVGEIAHARLHDARLLGCIISLLDAPHSKTDDQ
jgi:hypothetical protein